VTTATRSEVLPDIPTVSEFLPGYEASGLFGIGAPKSIPTEIIDKLNKEINVALADLRMKARLADLGGTVISGSPADFAKPTMVPFNGAGPAINALIGGQVDYMCDGGTMNSVPHVQSGAIRAYVIDAEQRSPILPNVPTSKEAGLPEFQVSAWNALFAPKGTPKAILDKLTDALDKALDDQNVRKRLVDLATEIPDKANRGQQSLAVYVKREVLRWTTIIKAANIKAE
jgi:tripartite-type tricarboxylate transporter receptor subunit TctC